MVLTDKFLRVMDAQALTGASVVSGSSIDVRREIGSGFPIDVLFTVTTALTTGDAATGVRFEVIMASDALLTTAIVVVGSSGSIPFTALTVSTNPHDLNGRVIVPIAAQPIVGDTAGVDRSAAGVLSPPTHRYLGVRVVGVGGTLSAGALIVDVINSASHTTAKNYPSGFIAR